MRAIRLGLAGCGGSSLADGGSIEDGAREGDGKVVLTWSVVQAIEVEPKFTG